MCWRTSRSCRSTTTSRSATETPRHICATPTRRSYAPNGFRRTRRWWRIEAFTEFCAARRELLAAALNTLLGLTSAATETQPLDADEAPEPEIGAWAEGRAERLEEAA